MNRNQIIEYLISNCECWNQPGDREILNRMNDDKLAKLQEITEKEQQAVVVANTAISGFTDGKGSAYRVNPETGRWERKSVPTNNQDDEEEEQVAMAKRRKSIMPEEDDEDEEMEEQIANRRRMRNSSPRTADEWLRSAPVEVQNMVQQAQMIDQREKDKIISQILVNANIADCDRRAHSERLQKRSLQELQNDLDLMPKTNEDVSPRVTNSRNSSPRAASDVLLAPTIDWKETNRESTNQNGQANGHVLNTEFEDATDDDQALANLSPRMRAIVNNARQLEQREKARLIDELTANIADENQAAKMAHRLRNKSLEDLKDMAALLPRRMENQRVNYFGSAPNPSSTTVNTRSFDSEDVLVPQTIDWNDAKQQK